MKYSNILRGTFIRRINRFTALVRADGNEEIVHVKNTGRLESLLISGNEIWLTAPGTPGRKTKFDLVAVRNEAGKLFNIDSQAPNAVVKEWLGSQDYDLVLSEYRYGDSRIDFYMERKTPGGIERYLMEVKGCTKERDGAGFFPDAPTERGVKHIRELIRARHEGYKTILVFVIQMDGVEEVRPDREIHPGFADAMEEAAAAGVEILFLTCHVESDELVITGYQ